mmetsp:Transcript_33710/g.62054  ORF Transcript_33710/g.62054 Transcript_33710/m.62054 type:complete len:85 (-) Transcript_33710:165-419(-)
MRIEIDSSSVTLDTFDEYLAAAFFPSFVLCGCIMVKCVKEMFHLREIVLGAIRGAAKSCYFSSIFLQFVVLSCDLYFFDCWLEL